MRRSDSRMKGYIICCVTVVTLTALTAVVGAVCVIKTKLDTSYKELVRHEQQATNLAEALQEQLNIRLELVRYMSDPIPHVIDISKTGILISSRGVDILAPADRSATFHNTTCPNAGCWTGGGLGPLIFCQSMSGAPCSNYLGESVFSPRKLNVSVWTGGIGKVKSPECELYKTPVLGFGAVENGLQVNPDSNRPNLLLEQGTGTNAKTRGLKHVGCCIRTEPSGKNWLIHLLRSGGSAVEVFGGSYPISTEMNTAYPVEHNGRLFMITYPQKQPDDVRFYVLIRGEFSFFSSSTLRINSVDNCGIIGKSCSVPYCLSFESDAYVDIGFPGTIYRIRSVDGMRSVLGSNSGVTDISASLGADFDEQMYVLTLCTGKTGICVSFRIAFSEVGYDTSCFI